MLHWTHFEHYQLFLSMQIISIKISDLYYLIYSHVRQTFYLLGMLQFMTVWGFKTVRKKVIHYNKCFCR